MYTIYMHTAPSGKRYIGQTRQDVSRRWRNGNGYSNNTYFFRAIKKYGWDNIKHEILFTVETLQEANEAEAALIRQYKSDNPAFGYNISGGYNGKTPMAESTKRKLSAIGKGRFAGETNPNYGRRHTEEELKVMSEKSRAYYQRHEHPRKGTRLPDEIRAKLSKSRKASSKAAAAIQKLNASKAKPVRCVETGKTYASAHEVERVEGYSQGTVSAACRGEYKQAYGFHWEYI